MWKLRGVREVNARLDAMEAEMRALKAFLCEMREQLRAPRAVAAPVEAPPPAPAEAPAAANVVMLRPVEAAAPALSDDAKAACAMLRGVAGDLRTPRRERAA